MEILISFFIFLLIIPIIYFYETKNHYKQLHKAEDFFKQNGYEIVKLSSFQYDEIHLVKNGVKKKFIQENNKNLGLVEGIYTPYYDCELKLIEYKKIVSKNKAPWPSG